ncbi:hypothetical protein LCI18_008623 [Fusarium solani-melongenae]|uniref:Uncharacterized protein n=1 Tax=Fusarium solani subsp. cucurbitae TaxID=2747967 RepID=A0ACD3Z8V5_FUSSC|nr:hypothetical protein LCI18_008623 [Fusarium solani-melongenae]
MNTNNQGTASKRPQPYSSPEQDKYTRPPRVSFGVELEFLVFYRTSGIDDESASGLPPVESTYMPVSEMIAQTLRGHGLDAYSTQSTKADRSGPLKWAFVIDGSVSEQGAPDGLGNTGWQNVELNSPPLYSCDEAFRLLAAVIRLITTNFRVRVNQTCGLHVHVGNGPHHLDMRAMRNYAVLLWATDSVLSTLQCPGRSVCHYSQSNRRIAYTELACDVSAQQAHGIVTGASSWVPRFLGRARKLGEAPVVSRRKLRQHIEEQNRSRNPDHTALDPECLSDDSDWEAPNSKPFFRPKKQSSQARRHTRRIPDEEFQLKEEEEEARLDGETITRELPPQVDFDLVGLDPPPSPPPGSTPKPFLGEERPRKKQLEVEKILKDDKITSRYEELTVRPVAESWKLTWPGVKELLSCDVGVHQVALLMSGPESEDRYASSNWSSNTVAGMTPGDPAAKGGRRTIECRLGGGSLDAEWVVTWTKIQCRLLEWARDAEPSAFMEVLCKLARDDRSDGCTYDVVDLLRDLGMYTEMKICEKRLERAEEAWYQCMLFEDLFQAPFNLYWGSGSSGVGSEDDASSNADNQWDTSVNNTDEKTSSGAGNEDDSEDIYDAD